jgi:D-alanyl-D-alanine carboxypeptidase (penicillin-binding protein 5/6)
MLQPALVAPTSTYEPLKFTPKISLVNPEPIPTLKDSAINPVVFAKTLSAQSIYVMDEKSASILLEKNSQEARFPASTTKMMTALVARKLYQPDYALTVKSEAFTEGTTMGLVLGEQMTVKNLLQGLLIESGNDAAFVLANNYPLGYDGFIGEMNTLAQDLHLDQTNFTNPSGLDEPQHQTTARDFAILAKELMKDPILKEIVGTSKITVTDVTGKYQHQLRTTNELLGKNGVVGIKTGTTLQAGETLVTQVDRDDHTLIIVVMSSQDRYGETIKIIDWVFNNYEWLQVDPELTKLL